MLTLVAEELKRNVRVEEIRITVPGHTQRGGSPCPYDRVLATRLGAAAAELIMTEQYGYMIGIRNGGDDKSAAEGSGRKAEDGAAGFRHCPGGEDYRNQFR